jgi:hypothetical protein
MFVVVTVFAVWLGVTANVVHKRRDIGTVLLDMHERRPKDLTDEKIIEVFPESKVMVWSDHPGPNEWRPPNLAKDARDKAYAEKLRAKREARKERMKARQPSIENR